MILSLLTFLSNAQVIKPVELPEEIRFERPIGDDEYPIHFFGGDEYGWYTPASLKSFEEAFAEHSKPKKELKNFKEALEEAKEALNKKKGGAGMCFYLHSVLYSCPYLKSPTNPQQPPPQNNQHQSPPNRRTAATFTSK